MFNKRKFATRSSLVTAARRSPERAREVRRPRPSSARCSTKLTCGLTWDTTKLLQLNSSVSRADGMSAVMVPSKDETPGGWNGASAPVFGFFAKSSNGSIKPGSAHDAFTAVRTTTCGAVKWFSTNPCPVPTDTWMLTARLLTANASANVTSPKYFFVVSAKSAPSIKTPFLAKCSAIFHTGGNHRTPWRLLRSARIVFNNSSSGNMETNAATMEPPEVPLITCGSKPCSSSVLITPKWYIANAPPPDKHSAVRPRLRCVSDTRRSVSFTSTDARSSDSIRAAFSVCDSVTGVRSEAFVEALAAEFIASAPAAPRNATLAVISSMNASALFFVPSRACRSRDTRSTPAKFLCNTVRSASPSAPASPASRAARHTDAYIRTSAAS